MASKKMKDRQSNTNSHGVPHHEFILVLDGYKTERIDIATEEHWENVTDFIDQTGHRGIAYGNDVDEYDEIHIVIDCETLKTLNPYEWHGKWIVPYINNYASLGGR